MSQCNKETPLINLIGILEDLGHRKSLENAIIRNLSIKINPYLLNSSAELVSLGLDFFRHDTYLQILYEIIVTSVDKNPSKIIPIALDFLALIQKHREIESETSQFIDRYNAKSILITCTLSASIGLLLGISTNVTQIKPSIFPLFPSASLQGIGISFLILLSSLTFSILLTSILLIPSPLLYILPQTHLLQRGLSP